MKKKYYIALCTISLVIVVSLAGFANIIRTKLFHKEQKPVLIIPDDQNQLNILFLHHSTGRLVYEAGVEQYLSSHNKRNTTEYSIYEQNFPKLKPYGWHNYPYDYWNIWVNHQGNSDYKREPTLEMITEHYDVVIFKHCFPVSNIENDSSAPKIDSEKRTTGSYKLQYNALKDKLHEFNSTKFILWTTPALLEVHTNNEEAQRVREFHDWVINDWNDKGDNIFLWDFYSLETEGDLFLPEKNAAAKDNSHPGDDLCNEVAPLFAQRIIDVIEGRGDTEDITGRR